jgi:hypothetical protein
MTGSKCHIVGIILRRRGIGGGRLSEQTIRDQYPKNVNNKSAADALDDACNGLGFLDRGPGGVCIPSGRKQDVTKFLRDNCKEKYSVLKRYL